MSWVSVAKTSELIDDVPFPADVDDELCVVLVRHQGRLYALENECSHAKVELHEGDVLGDTIECYLHGAAFDLATGEALSLPATQPVRVFPVRIEGDDVQVDPSTNEDF